MKKSCLLGVLGIVSVSAFAGEQPPAPFGLEWGQGIESISKYSPNCGTELNRTTCTVSKLSKAPSIQNSFFELTFFKGYGLTEAKMIVDYPSDDLGMDAYINYSNLFEALEAKYGQPISESSYSNVYDYGLSVNDYFTCLAIAGCGSQSASFETSGEPIYLYVSSREGMPGGHLTLRYSSPNHMRAVNAPVTTETIEASGL